MEADPSACLLCPRKKVTNSYNSKCFYIFNLFHYYEIFWAAGIYFLAAFIILEEVFLCPKLIFQTWRLPTRAAMTIYLKTRLFRLTPIGKPDLSAETAAEKQRFWTCWWVNIYTAEQFHHLQTLNTFRLIFLTTMLTRLILLNLFSVILNIGNFPVK